MGGKVRTSLGDLNSGANDAVLQPDGKIVDAECNIKSEPDLNTYCYTDVHPIAYSNSHGDCDRDPGCHAIRHADTYCNADLNSKTDTDSEE